MTFSCRLGDFIAFLLEAAHRFYCLMESTEHSGATDSGRWIWRKIVRICFRYFHFAFFFSNAMDIFFWKVRIWRRLWDWATPWTGLGDHWMQCRIYDSSVGRLRLSRVLPGTGACLFYTSFIQKQEFFKWMWSWFINEPIHETTGTAYNSTSSDQ